MVSSAPRVDDRLLALLEHLARTSSTPAEIRRLIVARARELGIAPPSYEHIRRIVTTSREERAIELERQSEVLPVLARTMVGAEHGNELVRVARGERPRRAK
jgi:hypothetical protein